MPNALTDYLLELEAAGTDVTQHHEITEKLGQIAQQLEGEQDVTVARHARIEQEVLAASKSLESKVGYQISGTRKDEEGNEHEVGWPDTSCYDTVEYEYIKERFRATTNLYLKSEYGFFLFLKKQAGRPEQVAELVQVFFELSQSYFGLEATSDKGKFYVLHAVQTLMLAFRIAVGRQRDQQVAPLLPTIVDYLIAVHQRWDASRTGSPMLLGSFTSLVAEQPALFKRDDLLTAFLARNREAVEVLSRTYRYGAMELAQATAQLAKQAKLDVQPWQLLVAEQYEELSHEATANRNAAAVAFTQQALRLYREFGEAEATTRMEQQYQHLRTEFALNEVSTSLPDEENRARLEVIMQQVADNTEEQLIELISLAPMFTSVEAVREYEKTADESFTDLFPTIIEDKHGNPVQRFRTPEEKREFRVLNAYGMLGQLATQTLVKLMLEAYKAGKLTAEGIAKHLSGTWLGQPRVVREHGRVSETNPLRMLLSGIRVLFFELDRWRAGQTDEPDFIAATDSLVLKVEYILRYICARLNIATFHPKRDGVVHEKLLDELLRDLAGEGRLDPDDLFFIRFYLQEKAGQNLRNRVAHGLMDDDEYGLENAFLVLTIILKLANYEFRPMPHD